MSQIQIPKGWELTTLEEVCAKITDGDHQTPQRISSGMMMLTAKNVLDGVLDFSNVDYVSRDDYEKSIRRCNPEFGDILLSCVGSIGRNSVITEKTNFMLVRSVALLKPKTKVLPKYLSHYLRSNIVKRSIEQLKTGSAVKSIYLKDIKKIPVLLPDISIQQQIVQKLDYILGELEEKEKEIIQLRQSVKIKKIHSITIQSILKEAFSGRLTERWRQIHSLTTMSEKIKEINVLRKEEYQKICDYVVQKGGKTPKKPQNVIISIKEENSILKIPQNWVWVALSDVASTRSHAMSSGPFGSSLGTKDYQKDGIPIIRGQNIQNGKFILKNFVYVSKDKAKELKRSSAHPRDIVSVAVGSSGSSAIVPDTLPFSILSQNCNKITLDERIIIPEYVNYFLQLGISKAQLQEKTTDTARPFLSLTNLKKTLIPLPSLDEQKEILKRIDQRVLQTNIINEKLDSILNLYDNMLKLSDQIPSKILETAFSGKLVN